MPDPTIERFGGKKRALSEKQAYALLAHQTKIFSRNIEFSDDVFGLVGRTLLAPQSRHGDKTLGV